MLFDDVLAPPRRGAGPVKVQCENCGKTELEKPSRAARYRFCSRACFGAFHKKSCTFQGKNNPRYIAGPVSIICENCGKPKILDAVWEPMRSTASARKSVSANTWLRTAPSGE